MIPQIRCFLAVLEEGSLHRAASRLHLSQSALSRQMQALEHELGGQLLERSSTGVRPTQGGRALARRMGDLLTGYDACLLDVRRILRGDSGELRIGYLAATYQEYLEPALMKLRRHHPDTRVKMLDLFPGEQIIELRQGNIDIAVTLDIGNLLGKEFHTQRLAVIQSIACLPCDHPLADRTHLSLAELKGATFLVASDPEIPGFRRRLLQLCRTCGKFRPKMAENSGGLAEAFSTVANESVVALMPAYLRSQKRPGMVIVPVSDPGATWELTLAWPKGQISSPLRLLLEAMPS